MRNLRSLFCKSPRIKLPVFHRPQPHGADCRALWRRLTEPSKEREEETGREEVGREMETQWVLVAHGLLTLLVVVSFLCGQWPIFQGTIIERIHHFITFGLYDYFL